MKEYCSFPDSLEYIDLEEILKKDNLDFTLVTTDENYIGQYEGEDILVHLTDKNHPIAFGKSIMSIDSCGILINPEYYQNNKEYINKMLCKIIMKNKNTDLYIRDKSLITDEIIDTMINNSNIKYVSLRDINNVAYSLSEKLYLKFKEKGNIRVATDKVDPELEENFDPIIVFNSRSLIGYYNYKELSSNSNLAFYSPINNEEIKYFKYINHDATLEFYKDDFGSVVDVLKLLKEKGMHNTVKITVDDKNKFNFYLFKNEELFKSSDIEVRVDADKYDINTYFNYEKRLIDMVEPAMKLSPFERYLFAYNVVKQYKKYKENENDKTSARNVYQILDNDYMVCVGYSKLLEDLCSKLGINIKEISVSVAIGQELNPNIDMVANDTVPMLGNHARVMVEINDSKYGIDGVYFADPTWDNNMEKDLYLFAALTQDEYYSLYRENFNSMPVYDLFSSGSLEEFYNRVNYFMNLKLAKDKKVSKEYILSRYESNREKLKKFDFINEIVLMDMIKDVLINKHGYSMNNNFYINGLDKNSFIFDSFNNIVDSYKFAKCKNKDDVLKIVNDEIESKIKRTRVKSDIPEYCIINDLLNFISIINPGLYKMIKVKYPAFNSYNFDLSMDDISDIITMLGEYIVSVNNNKIDGKIIMSAVEEVYKAKGMSDEEIASLLPKVINDNKKNFELNFPKRMKINPDGTQFVYINGENKFDIASQEMKLG